MIEETLETLILGHIAKELKDEIQIERQVNLAKTIIQALRIHNVSGQGEQCAHTSTDIRTLRCNCCNDCGEILEMID